MTIEDSAKICTEVVVVVVTVVVVGDCVEDDVVVVTFDDVPNDEISDVDGITGVFEPPPPHAVNSAANEMAEVRLDFVNRMVFSRGNAASKRRLAPPFYFTLNIM